MGKRERMKGVAYERAVARFLNDLELIHSEFARNVEETQGGNLGDVLDKRGTYPFVIQAKHRQRMDVLSAVREAVEASNKREEFTLPMAFLKWHGGPEIVAMPRDVFATILLALDRRLDWMGAAGMLLEIKNKA